MRIGIELVLSVTGEAEAALLGSNPPRNSLLENFTPMDREPIGTGRLPALGGCEATISASIGVDLPIP